MRNTLKLLCLLSVGVLSAGCDTLHFYSQAVWGQIQLLQARTPLTRMQQTADLEPQVAQRLVLAESILAYTEAQLGVSAQGRYSSYVHLDREFVVWNVFAAPAFDLTGRQWCYPIVGCAPYRGYFKEAAARGVAEKYAERGFETYVGGVPAYSTLGWFDDPLLSTFILWPEADLANLLIHEVAHGRVWVASDVMFNESFAEFVGNQGAVSWLESQGRGEAWQDWLERRQGWLGFRKFVVQAKQYLEDVYQLPEPAAAKQQAFADLQACYQARRLQLGGGRYDDLMERHFNNAFLVSVATYADWLPAFAALFGQADGQWQVFFALVDELAELSVEDRDLKLQMLLDQQVDQNNAYSSSQEKFCASFLSVEINPPT